MGHSSSLLFANWNGSCSIPSWAAALVVRSCCLQPDGWVASEQVHQRAARNTWEGGELGEVDDGVGCGKLSGGSGGGISTCDCSIN